MATKKKSSGLKWLFFLVVLGGLAWGGYRYYERPKDEATDYRTATISKGDIIQSVTANGQINPVKIVQVGSQISGIIKSIYVDFNSQVKENDLIAEIDAGTYDANVAQSEGELMNAKANLELTRVNYTRAKELFLSKLIAQADHDKALADLHQAEAAVKIREASLQKSQIDLSRTKIFAPISGVVISRNVDVGQTVAASFNTPTLFLIANDLTKMQIDAMVSEADVGGIAVGQPVNFSVEAFIGRQFRGDVKQVRFVPTTNQNVVTYDTVVEVNNDDMKLRPGMTANVSIITAQKRDTLRIPNAAFRFRPVEAMESKPAASAAPAATSTSPSTNKPAEGATAVAASGSGGGGGGGGEGGGRMSPEERRKRFESMTPEQREEFRQRMAARFGNGGGGGGGGFGGGGFGRMGGMNNRPDGPVTRTVYLLEKSKSADGKAKPQIKGVTIKTGINDGSYTEVIEGLKEGDEVITGVNTPTAAGFGGPGGGGPGGGTQRGTQNPFSGRRF